MPDSSDEPGAQAWSQLWAQSPRGAIDLAAEDPVAQALRGHWQAQAGWLAACDEVVDVGSGPAVLPLHLLGSTGDALGRVRWRCLDRASFAAEVGQALPGAIALEGGVDFADSVPAGPPAAGLVSNFGLEYVRRDGVAAACRRWLAPAGRLSAVVHARGSVVDQVSQNSVDDLDLALRDARLFETSRELLSAMASLPSDPVERMMYGVDIRDAYNASVNALKERMQQRGAYSGVLVDMLNTVRDLAGWVRQGRLDEALAQLAQRRLDYAAERLRLADMQASAMDQAQVAGLAEQLRAAGFDEAGYAPLDCRLGRVAWLLSAGPVRS